MFFFSGLFFIIFQKFPFNFLRTNTKIEDMTNMYFLTYFLTRLYVFFYPANYVIPSNAYSFHRSFYRYLEIALI